MTVHIAAYLSEQFAHLSPLNIMLECVLQVIFIALDQKHFLEVPIK